MNITEKVDQLSESQAVQMQILSGIRDTCGELKDHIIGKPSGRPGLVVRVDRLEVSNRFKGKVLWLFGGTAAGGLVSWIASKF